jgi:hypothetical protein
MKMDLAEIRDSYVKDECVEFFIADQGNACH